MWGAFPLYFSLFDSVNPVEVVAYRIVWSLAFCTLLLFAVRGWGEVGRTLRDRRRLGLLALAGVLAMPATANAGCTPGVTSDGTQNTCIGTSALNSITSGGSNTATGYEALKNNTTGIGNTADGAQALASNTTGNSNTASGYLSLYTNTTGSSNTASGYGA